MWLHFVPFNIVLALIYHVYNGDNIEYNFVSVFLMKMMLNKTTNFYCLSQNLVNLLDMVRLLTLIPYFLKIYINIEFYL